MFDSKVSTESSKSGFFFLKESSNDSAQVENIKLRERVAHLEKEIINVSVDIENKNAIIDTLQTWKNLLALLNSPQYSEVSIEINKRISQFENMDAEFLKAKKEYLTLKKQYKKLEDGLELLRSQYTNDVKNMKVINESTFDQEKVNIQSTLNCLTQEANILSSKNEEILRELQDRPYYRVYDEIRNEIIHLKEEFDNLKKMKEIKN